MKTVEAPPRPRSPKPPASPLDAARRTLRIIGLTLVQRIDADDADLRTLAEQTRQAGELALAELGAK